MGLFDKFGRKDRVESIIVEPMPRPIDNGMPDDDPVEDIVEPPAALEPTTPSAEVPEPAQSTPVQVASEDQGQTAPVQPVPPQPQAGTIQSQATQPVVRNTKIMAILNQKGGVGKSTTAINLSAALGALNKTVLLIDLDPQGNATSGLGVDKKTIENDTYDVLIGRMDIKQAIIPQVCKGLDLLPATINLAGAEVELVNEMARETRLKQALESVKGLYDYVLIDCPPSLGLLTVNALVAAQKLFIPIQCEFYALEGVTKLLDSMKRVKSMLNPNLEIFGVLLTMYDNRTTLSRQVAEEVRKYFGSMVFETMIPRTVKLSEAPSYGQPIIEYDPTGKGARSYWALAEEVINRG